MPDPGTIAIGSVALLPLILGLIQFVKSLAPRADTNIWRALSFALGLAGQVVVFVVAQSDKLGGWSLATWALCVVLGLETALSTSAAYDATIGRAQDKAAQVMSSGKPGAV